MSLVLNKETKLILKLDLGEDGVRRVPLSKLWDDSRNTVSHARLVELTIEFKNMKLKAVQNGRVTVCTTYTDEDGDEITISSDEELLDAFEQFAHATPPVVRAKAIVVKKKSAAGKQRDREETHDKECDNNLTNEKVVPVEEESKPKLDGVKENKKDVESKEEQEQFPGLDPNFIHGRHTCDGCLTTPIFGIRYHAINLPDYDLCSGCHANYKGTSAIFKPVQLDRDRHLQTRWQRRFIRCPRAARPFRFRDVAKIPAMDDGKNVPVDFALKEAIRRSLLDAYPQEKKYIKEEQSSSKADDNEAAAAETVPLIPPTEQNEPDVEVAPALPIVVEVSPDNEDPKYAKYFKMLKMGLPVGAVKNALQRDGQDPSIMDLDPNKSLMHQTKPDVEVAPASPIVVEVSAGNEHTQKVLDSMDLELKESLSRSLSKCFSGSISTNESQSSKNDYEKAVDLTPLADTQTKIKLMDEATKAEIRRSLTEFFANRSSPRISKKEMHHELNEFFDCRQNTDAGSDGNEENAKAEIHRGLAEFFAKRFHSVGNGGAESREAIHRELDEFFAQRSKANSVDGSKGDDSSEVKNNIETVVVDIVMDNDDQSGVTENDKASNVGDDDNNGDMESNVSEEGSVVKDEWQMVVEDGEMIAVAAQMLGSALFQSDSNLSLDDSKSNDA